MKKGSRASGLIARFAVSAFVALVGVGILAAFVLLRDIREGVESSAERHARVVAESSLRYEFSDRDLAAPVRPDGERYEPLLESLRARILRDGIVRIKIWGADGTILFSDAPNLVGRRFPVPAGVRAAFGGQTTSRVSDLSAPDDVLERPIAPALFETYVPFVPATTVGDANPQAVAEIDQDYRPIQGEAGHLFRTSLLTLLAGLGLLALLLLPILLRVSRALSEQNARLQQHARDTEELLRQEHQTVGELRKLNRIQGEFVAVASHELRTPLTSIIGYAKTLRQPQFATDPAAREEFLQAIERQGDRLFQLVENLLTSSHLDEHILRLTISTFSFRDLVRDVVEGLGSKGARVRLSLPHDLPSLISDRQYVAQILSNLLGNALKFSPERLPCDVTARWEGGSLTFSVTDQGIGIPRGELGRIFDRFYQVDSSSTRPYGGIGLGLSLVKELVQALGGEIEVRSELKEGSTFTVTLPLVHPSVGKQYGHTGELNEAESGARRRPAPQRV